MDRGAGNGEGGCPTIHACFHAFTWSGYSPFSRQYSLNPTSDSRAVSTTAANLDSADQKRIRELEWELRRKDKALAEAAALLILRKKLNALWGDDAGED